MQICENDMDEEEHTAHLVDTDHQRQNIDAALSTLDHRLPTLSQIKVKIPRQCFRSSTLKSMFYAILDIIFIALAYIVMTQLETSLKYKFLLFPLYWYVQGTLYMALFSIGHDCAHASFSIYPLLNDGIGTVVFTWILIPYYPWKITHQNHHKNTGNMDKDEAFFPKRGETYNENWMSNVILWAPGLAWFYYLICGDSPRGSNHFNPFESIYAQHLIGVSLSLAAYAAMLYLMFIYAIHMSISSLIVYHLIPVLVFATYLVIVTLLHHTEMNVPWFVDDEWNYVKGQLSTVDRNYGHVHSIIHSIGTHQIHHLFPKISHYHLEEATVHFRKAFPNLVRINDDRILSSFVRMSKKFIRQRNIANDASVFTYSDDQDNDENHNY